MKVKEVMSARSLKYCSPETKLHNAAKTMKAGNCGALPVIDKQKKVIGLVTDRDIALSLSKKQANPSRANVGDIISKRVYTVNQNDNLSDALAQMRTNQIGRLPVVDDERKLKGIVSMHNLINQATGNGKLELGRLSSTGENLVRTIQAITNRYSNGRVKK
ncbi:MAG: CBS domain-containing protein [Bacteroidetes bacterium]|nr:MAG: CBS domain-containing protein [Bacteroidota bacterium]